MILRFTQKITNPIKQLTHLTEMIKQATGRDSREQVLKVIESHPIVQQTKKQVIKGDGDDTRGRKQSTRRDTDSTMAKSLIDKSKLHKS